MERIISSDMMKVLMGEDRRTFVTFLLSPGNEVLRWEFEQTRNYDLELPVVQAEVNALCTAGIFSVETRDRILNYQLPSPVPDQHPQYTYYTSTIADDALVTEVVPYCTFTGDRSVWAQGNGNFFIIGTCNHPDVTEVV